MKASTRNSKLPKFSKNPAVGSDAEMQRLSLPRIAWVLAAIFALAPTAAVRAQHNTTVTVDGVASNLAVAFTGTNNLLQVIHGAVLTNTGTFTSGSAARNTAVAAGSGTRWTNTTGIYVGFQGAGNNLLVVSNGAHLVASWIRLGFDAAGGNTNNGAIFTDPGTLVLLTGGDNSLGRGPSGNWLTVSNGAVVSNTHSSAALTLGASGTPSNNRALITGSNSQWISTGVNETKVGMYGQGNSLTIADGAFMSARLTLISDQAGSSDNLVTVADRGSILTNFNSVTVGAAGANGRLVVSNGGAVYAGNTASDAVGAGRSAGGSGSILVTGAESLLSTPGGVAVGSNGTLNGYGHLLVADGGIVQATRLESGYDGTGTISNRGGVFQFTTATPTISPLTAGSIVVTNGVIGFRAIHDAPVNLGGTSLTNLVFQGDNSFRLNAATNAAGLASYTFDSVANTGQATNYQRLILTGKNPSWRSTALTLGAGGELVATNTAGASIGAALTNLGTVRVVNGSVAFNGNVVNLGAWITDPMTNAFNGNYTVGPAATIVAAAGDVFAFGSNFVMQSTNRAFDMSGAIVYFGNTNYGITTGTTNHLFDLAGSGALDEGSNLPQLATNFSIGRLVIAADNRLMVTGQVGGGMTNALYVGTLDLSAWATNAANLTNTLQAAISLPNINLYYDGNDPNNAYLGQETFSLWGGGGSLIPVPEPEACALLLAGILVFVRRMRDRG